MKKLILALTASILVSLALAEPSLYHSVVARKKAAAVIGTPTVVDSDPSQTSFRTTATLDATTATEGALLVLIYITRGIDAVSVHPSGFSAVDYNFDAGSSDDPKCYVYLKTASASEGSYTFTSNNSTWMSAVLVEITGASATISDSASTGFHVISDDLGDVTVPAGGVALGIMGHGTTADVESVSAPTGYTQIANQNGTNHRMGIAVSYNTTSGATGVVTYTTTDNAGTIHLAIAAE